MPRAIVLYAGDLELLNPLVACSEVIWEEWELTFVQQSDFGDENLEDVRVVIILHDLTEPIDHKLLPRLKLIPDTEHTLRVILVGTNYDEWRKLSLVVRIQRKWKGRNRQSHTPSTPNFTTLQAAKRVCAQPIVAVC